MGVIRRKMLNSSSCKLKHYSASYTNLYLCVWQDIWHIHALVPIQNQNYLDNSKKKKKTFQEWSAHTACNLCALQQIFRRSGSGGSKPEMRAHCSPEKLTFTMESNCWLAQLGGVREGGGKPEIKFTLSLNFQFKTQQIRSSQAGVSKILLIHQAGKRFTFE